MLILWLFSEKLARWLPFDKELLWNLDLSLIFVCSFHAVQLDFSQAFGCWSFSLFYHRLFERGHIWGRACRTVLAELLLSGCFYSTISVRDNRWALCKNQVASKSRRCFTWFEVLEATRLFWQLDLTQWSCNWVSQTFRHSKCRLVLDEIDLALSESHNSYLVLLGRLHGHRLLADLIQSLYFLLDTIRSHLFRCFTRVTDNAQLLSLRFKR